MKKITKNKYANFYLNAAESLGLDYEIINEKVGLARIFNETVNLDVSSNVLGVNTQLSSSLSVNKVKTSTLLQEKNIPVPNFRTFKDRILATKYASKQLLKKKYVVIKPISGSLSIGITVKPSSVIQIKKAIIEAFEGNSCIMIESYVPGNHYRVTVLDNEIIAITRRIPANILCDGKNTVKFLIAEKNVKRRKMKLPEIFLRDKDKDYIKKEKIELSKIYPDGTLIDLQLGCDLDIGGERVRIDRDSIPQINLDLFIKATQALTLRFAGIDYITPDIMIPHAQCVTAINEINSAPDSDVHYRDTYPHDNYAAERIVKKIFSQKISLTDESVALPFIQHVPVVIAD
ncbi:MAG: ATP-grasp domain-containing protein [Candidatus Levybacteria bacterium]|nr:ATP-grasp domain-containing protein [Candidatus Levybacteria bacterium]